MFDLGARYDVPISPLAGVGVEEALARQCFGVVGVPALSCTTKILVISATSSSELPCSETSGMPKVSADIVAGNSETKLGTSIDILDPKSAHWFESPSRLLDDKHLL